MANETQEKLQIIRKLLKKVGRRLSALDYDGRNSIDHWGAIGEYGETIREITTGLPKEVQEQLPELMAYANREKEIYLYWGTCCDEVNAALQ